MDDAARSAASGRSPEEKAPKKVYTSPRLTAYGDVAKLTQGGGSRPKADGASGMARANQN